MTEKLKVVIAEDDRQIAEIQRRFLERVAGFEVVGIGHTIRDTLELIEVFQPQLVLLDIHFPDGSGLELLRQLRAADSCTDVIMVTAAKEVDSLSDALRLGVFDYVLKPLVFERLEEALTRFQAHKLSLSRAGQELSQQAVDQLLPRGNSKPEGTQHPLKPAALPKGIDQITLDKVRSAFNAATTTFSAEQVGEKIGSSRTTARRYLEYLVGQNELIADISYGSVGRPERLYSKL